MAVSGYYPEAAEWGSKSYTQLAMELFMSRDRDRLRALANVLGTTHYGRNEVLTRVMMAGVAELDADADMVLGYFDPHDFDVVKNLLDPAITDFALKIILRLKEDAVRYHLPGPYNRKINEAETHLIRKLIEIKKSDLQG